jgi:secreted trypsin-like serine protease
MSQNAPRQPRHAALLSLLLLSACGDTGAPPEYCGETSAAIFGGAADGGTPDIALAVRSALVSIDVSDGSTICTGTLVSPGRVLTAAHCHVLSDLSVRTLDGRKAQSSRVVTHPDLDVMIIELMPDAGFSTILPLSTAGLDAGSVGKHAQLAGVGRTERGTLGELRFAEEPIVDVRPNEIWVDGNGTSGACDGDSGGPLLGFDADGRLGVLGVLSRGSRDCRGVDVYVRSSALRPWLAQLSSGCGD